MIIGTRLRQSYGAAGRDYRRREIEFFCRLNVRQSWFFDIYIQGSKKVQL